MVVPKEVAMKLSSHNCLGNFYVLKNRFRDFYHDNTLLKKNKKTKLWHNHDLRKSLFLSCSTYIKSTRKKKHLQFITLAKKGHISTCRVDEWLMNYFFFSFSIGVLWVVIDRCSLFNNNNNNNNNNNKG